MGITVVTPAEAGSVIAENAINTVMPVKTGIQNLLKLLDSPVSSTGQAHCRASLARNDKKVITTQSRRMNILEFAFFRSSGFLAI